MDDCAKAERKIIQNELQNAKKLLLWNKRLYSFYGIDPTNFKKAYNTCIFIYITLHLFFTSLDLSRNFHDKSRMVDIVARLTTIMTVIGKFMVYRYKRQELHEILRELSSYYSPDIFICRYEVYAFIKYITQAKQIFKNVIPVMFGSVLLYFFRNFFLCVGNIYSEKEFLNAMNVFLTYRLSMQQLMKSKNYLGLYIFAQMIAPLAAFAIAADCGMFIAFVMHVCGRLSLLSQYRIKNLADDSDNFLRRLEKLLLEHNRLKRMVEKINTAFRIVLIQEMMSHSIYVCVIGYNTIMHWNSHERTVMIIYTMEFSTTLCVLFTYCYTGQCLIDESLNLSTAIYNTSWYELESKHMKYYIFLIERIQKPMVLTCGLLGVYSNKMFLRVLKTFVVCLSIARLLNRV